MDSRKLDIFSLGLISVYCLDSLENFYKYSHLLNENSNILHEEYLPQLKSKMPIEFYCVLKSMLSFDWNAHPSLVDLYDFTTVYLVNSHAIITFIFKPARTAIFMFNFGGLNVRRHKIHQSGFETGTAFSAVYH